MRLVEVLKPKKVNRPRKKLNEEVLDNFASDGVARLPKAMSNGVEEDITSNLNTQLPTATALYRTTTPPSAPTPAEAPGEPTHTPTPLDGYSNKHGHENTPTPQGYGHGCWYGRLTVTAAQHLYQQGGYSPLSAYYGRPQPPVVPSSAARLRGRRRLLNPIRAKGFHHARIVNNTQANQRAASFRPGDLHTHQEHVGCAT